MVCSSGGLMVRCSILVGLYSLQCAKEQRITIVQPAHDERLYDCFRGVGAYRSGDQRQLSKLKIPHQVAAT